MGIATPPQASKAPQGTEASAGDMSLRVQPGRFTFQEGTKVTVGSGKSVGVVESVRDGEDTLGRKIQIAKVTFLTRGEFEYDTRFLSRFVPDFSQQARVTS